MADRAYAMGAVIISDDSRMVKYHKKCDYCGNVDIGTTGSYAVNQGIIANIGFYNCPKCGKQSKVEIRRGC